MWDYLHLDIPCTVKIAICVGLCIITMIVSKVKEGGFQIKLFPPNKCLLHVTEHFFSVYAVGLASKWVWPLCSTSPCGMQLRFSFLVLKLRALLGIWNRFHGLLFLGTAMKTQAMTAFQWKKWLANCRGETYEDIGNLLLGFISRYRTFLWY